VVNKNLKPIVQILSPKTKKANNLIMLDRDGTINRDSGYTHKLSDLFILSKNLEIINEFVNYESTVLCITNQSGIGRGYFTKYQAITFNEALSLELKKYKISIK
jgi:D-glycero-D-manno-heptose 1,7-bisphosphate phosphatase